MANKMIDQGINQTLNNLAGNIHTMSGSGILGSNSLLLPKSERKTDIDYLREIYAKQSGKGLDIQKALSPFGELHMRTPTGKKYNFCGPGTKLEQRLARGDKNINKLDEVCKDHDIAYPKAKILSDKHLADKQMVADIDKIPWSEKPWGKTAIRSAINMKQ